MVYGDGLFKPSLFFAVFSKTSDTAQQILDAPQQILDAPQEILDAPQEILEALKLFFSMSYGI